METNLEIEYWIPIVLSLWWSGVTKSKVKKFNVTDVILYTPGPCPAVFPLSFFNQNFKLRCNIAIIETLFFKASQLTVIISYIFRY